MEFSVPYPGLPGSFIKLSDALLSAEDGSIWREHTGVGRIAFHKECGVACDKGLLQLLLNFVNIVTDGIASCIHPVVGPAGLGADGTASKEKDHKER